MPFLFQNNISKYIIKSLIIRKSNSNRKFEHLKQFAKKVNRIQQIDLFFEPSQRYQFAETLLFTNLLSFGIFLQHWLENREIISRVQCPILKVFTAHRSDAILDKQVIKFCSENK